MPSSGTSRVAPGGAPLENPRRTKIVATVGPASSSPEVLRELFDAGVDVFRLNFAHGTPEDQAENVRRIRAVSEEVGREVGIMGDLPGPKLRIGDLEDDVAVLHSGSNVVLRGDTNGKPGNAELLTVQWDGFAKAVHRGRSRLPRRRPGAPQGHLRRRWRRHLRDRGGRRGELAPGCEPSGGRYQDLPETGASDQPWIDFACENGIDLLAVSFVRRPSDLEKVEARLRERGADIPLIAKIEKPQAAERAEEIIEAAGSGIMVARGDLGVELPIEEVPGRAEAADRTRRAGLQADDHGDPDARDDGAGFAADQGRGHRRGQRDLRRHRRGHALRGDRDRGLSG